MNPIMIEEKNITSSLSLKKSFIKT